LARSAYPTLELSQIIPGGKRSCRVADKPGGTKPFQNPLIGAWHAGCASATLGDLFGVGPVALVEVDNRLCARAGEQVVIGIPDAVLIRASLLVYLLPLLAMLAAVALATRAGCTEGAQALAGLAGLGASFLLTPNLTRGARARYRPSVLRRASPFITIAELGTDRGDPHD
jgi:sigma-E factor negative regulatory protein RseC